VGRDTYLEGRGRILIRLLDLFTIADATGAEYDTGELVTYLNGAVLIAPSMLLVPAVTWAQVDAGSFDVALTDHGQTVIAVVIDESRAPREFSTTDRFCNDPDNLKRLARARWTTPIAGWQTIDRHRLPYPGRGHLAPFTYRTSVRCQGVSLSIFPLGSNGGAAWSALLGARILRELARLMSSLQKYIVGPIDSPSLLKIP
jgi:hypothetical protein